MKKLYTYASFERRIFANIIDNFLIFVITFLIVAIITYASFDFLNTEKFIQMFSFDLTGIGSQFNYEHMTVSLHFIAMLLLLHILVTVGYYQLCLTTGKPSTPGMTMVHLELRQDNGSRVSGANVFFRTVFYVLLKMIYVGAISLITMFVTKKKQTIHDMLLKTVVINTEK